MQLSQILLQTPVRSQKKKTKKREERREKKEEGRGEERGEERRDRYDFSASSVCTANESSRSWDALTSSEANFKSNIIQIKSREWQGEGRRREVRGETGEGKRRRGRGWENKQDTFARIELG